MQTDTMQRERQSVESGVTRPLPQLLHALPSIVLFLSFFALYASMAAPELDWGDAGESQLAAWTAGLSHPTGYPIFLMLGWLWTHILASVGIVPTRAMTLFSVAAGALAVAVLVPTTHALLRRVTPEGVALPLSIGVAVAFGLSPTFWSQALLAEVYTFHILLLVLFLWGLWSSDSEKRLPWLALLYGVFLSHHRTAILWLPGLLIWLWREARWIFRPATFLKFVVLVALPQLAYLYIAVRGPATAYLHQILTPPRALTLYDGSWKAFTDHVLGTVFAADLGLQQSLTRQLAGIWTLLRANTTIILPMLAFLLFVRGVQLSHAVRSDLILLLTSGIATLLFGLFYAIADVEVMFIPTWLVLYLLSSIGLLVLWQSRSPIAVFVAIISMVALIATRIDYRPDSRADHTAPRELVTTLLRANPPANAILVTNDRNEMVPFWYTQFAEQQRQDILGVFPLITPAPEHAHVVNLVGWALQFDRPVYLTKAMPGLALRYDLEPAAPPLVYVRGPATLPTIPPQQSNLAPDLTVTGWQPPATIETGHPLTVSVGLLPLSPLVDLSFSLQVFDEAGTPITQTDVAPDTFYPPSQWTVEQPVRQLFHLTLPDNVANDTVAWRLSIYVLNPDGTFTSVGQQIVLGTTTP